MMDEEIDRSESSLFLGLLLNVESVDGQSVWCVFVESQNEELELEGEG